MGDTQALLEGVMELTGGVMGQVGVQEFAMLEGHEADCFLAGTVEQTGLQAVDGPRALCLGTTEQGGVVVAVALEQAELHPGGVVVATMPRRFLGLVPAFLGTQGLKPSEAPVTEVAASLSVSGDSDVVGMETADDNTSDMFSTGVMKEVQRWKVVYGVWWKVKREGEEGIGAVGPTCICDQGSQGDPLTLVLVGSIHVTLSHGHKNKQDDS